MFFGKPPTSSNQGQPASHAEARLLAWIFCRAMSSVPLAFQTWGSGARGTGRQVERLKERAGTVLEQSDIYLYIYIYVCVWMYLYQIYIYIWYISISGKYLIFRIILSIKLVINTEFWRCEPHVSQKSPESDFLAMVVAAIRPFHLGNKDRSGCMGNKPCWKKNTALRFRSTQAYFKPSCTVWFDLETGGWGYRVNWWETSALFSPVSTERCTWKRISSPWP